MTRPSLRILLPLVLALLLIAGAVYCFSPVRAAQLAATYAHGSLQVTIPYDAGRKGVGRLTTEILDPEDRVLGRAERGISVEEGNGSWQQTITPNKPIAFDDILWQRVRYRFEYSDGKGDAIEGIESVSQILRRPVVRVLGQSEYLSGSRAAIRVVVTDANDDAALDGKLRIELTNPANEKEAARQLFSGSLNHRGTLEASFRFPAGLAGHYELRFVADTAIGGAEYRQPIQIGKKTQILLTTEKPIYQPGQTIHVRALALDRADLKADGDRPLTFEIEDSRANKVFRKATETDKFGIASTEFTLADEVNLGTYHLRALMGDAESPSDTVEIALNVERYVLPKFKVAVDFAEKDGKSRRDYRPGDHVTGTVRANYFFGKPVDHAEIKLKVSSADVEVAEAATDTGKTDADGVYHFDLRLPGYFAGKPLTQGAARALVEATVTDSAAHAETRGEPITVSQSALLLTAVPEGGTLIPHMENEIFVLASYPDGSPASAALTVHPSSGGPAQRAETDASGVASIHFKPGEGAQSIHVEADDRKGNRASSEISLDTRTGEDQILLRTSRAVFKAGDPIQLKVLSTRSTGAAYIDVVKNGQTILTRDLDLANGQAELTLTATPEMAGTLDIDAYLFRRNAQPVADHRLVFVQPADELRIETTADADEYKPGAEARIRFHVTNAHGEGVSAALGLQVVDEAVFALAEKQPGFAKVFFYLEQEAMKPRYEIHSLSMENVVEPVRFPPPFPRPHPHDPFVQEDKQADEPGNLAARALFSATEMAQPTKLDVEFGRALPQDKFEEYQQRYRAAFVEQAKKIAEKLSQEIANHPGSLDVAKAFDRLAHSGSVPARDAWGQPVHLESLDWNQGRSRYFLLRSAGPDRQLDTADDLTVYIEDRFGKVVNRPGQAGANQAGSLGVRLEHDRGPLNGRAEVAGTVMDMTGAIIPAATVTLHTPTGDQTRTARCDEAGRFNLSGLEPGRYKVQVTSQGFEALSGSVTLEAQDRAVLSATLTVGAATEMITVNADMVAVPERGVFKMRAMGGAMAMDRLQMVPAQMAATGAMNAKAEKDIPLNNRNFAAMSTLALPQAAPAAHVRSWFPEALYINPEIVTDGKGDASVVIPIADSITTWRMAMLASTQSGALGSGTGSIKVFQDFFADLDLPVTLTQGDRVTLPVAVYNYAGHPGQVTLKLQPEDWFSLEGDAAEKSLPTESGQVGGSQFTISARRIGKFKLTLTAHLEGNPGRDDIVVREIEVIPNGREQTQVFNGRVENTASTAQHEIKFPANAIPDATTIVVRLYPGPLAQIMEGMDSILQMPGGCFEQTSSSTYPNVLALDYMKRTKKLTPEVHAKAEGFIAQGYQRLLTFEVPGGGFSWFGQAPANKILTSYGLMEFKDMSKVWDVDPRLIARTGDWLAQQQQGDGSWKPDTQFINEGATNRYNSDVLRITAYIGWALANTGYQGPAVDKAKQYIEAHMSGSRDTYTLAVIANFAVDYARDRDFTRRAMEALIDARTEKDDQISWNAQETGVYSTGESAAVETTGLAAQALLKWGQASGVARKALTFITSKKQASGNWGTTQATIMALRALVLASQLSAADVRGSVEVSLNGKPAETLKLTSENNDLFHQFVFKGIDASQATSVSIKFEGTGGLAYQVAGRYFTPWEEKPATEALSIAVSYDRAHLAENDIATATASIHNNLNKTANMVMVDLGIPPGFDLLSEDLQTMQEQTAGSHSGRLEKFSQTATQAILYFNSLGPGQTVTIKYRLRAKYPIRARTFASRVYEYYDPSVTASAHPIQLEVAERKR